MTRINPILFAVLLGLVAAVVFYLFIYIGGSARLQQIAIPVTVITAIGWFMAQRVVKKSRDEQFKQRMMAIGLTALALGAYLFADYKVFQESFNASCDRAGSRQQCECIEHAVGPKMWAQQLPLRPEVALGRMGYGSMLGQVNTANRDAIEAAARSCNR